MRAAMLSIVLAGCGRLGFDAAPDAGAPVGDRPPIASNLVFVTRGNLNPSTFGGLAGADAICNTTAAAAGLPGTYVAYLSTSTVDAIDRLAGARGWTRTDGTPFADTPADLAAGRVYVNAMYLADGSRAATNAYDVTTGTDATGRVSAEGTCGDWTTTGTTALGSATSSGSFGFGATGPGCGTGARIYCFGIDLDVPVPPPVPGGGAYRRAFLSSTPWFPGGGDADANAHCQADAIAHRLGGPFVAALATRTAPARARLTDGEPWMRLDGVLLAPTAADLLAGRIVEPLNLTADLAYVRGPDAYAWTGANRIDQTATSDATSCNAWTSTVPGQVGDLGRPEYADLYWFFQNPQTCNLGARLYCFEP